ncbi:MAG: hypothetical protein AB9869_10335 [Verrucomicrobiia bacterium]
MKMLQVASTEALVVRIVLARLAGKVQRVQGPVPGSGAAWTV